MSSAANDCAQRSEDEFDVAHMIGNNQAVKMVSQDLSVGKISRIILKLNCNQDLSQRDLPLPGPFQGLRRVLGVT